MKRIGFILITIMLGSSLAAQNFNKLYSVINGIPCYAQRVAVYPDGYVLFGETDDSTNNYARVSVTKIDTEGNLVWNKSYGKSGYGYFFGNLPGGGDGVSVPWGGYTEAGFVSNSLGTWYKLALYRFDNRGDTVWTRIYDDSTDETGITVKLTRDKKYIVGGQWYDNVGNGDFGTITLKKADTLGNTIWQKTYHGSQGHYRASLSLDTCKDEGYIICSWDGDTNNAYYCGSSIFIMKTDSAGTPQWTQYIYDMVCDVIPTYIISLRDGSYLVCGSYVDSIIFSGAEKFSKLYLAKISTTGIVKWTKQYGYGSWNGGTMFSIKELSNGDIIACGTDISNVLGCILKIDSNGNQKWLRYYKMQSPSEEDYLYDIKLLPNGGYVATGQTYGNTENIWLVKTDSLGCDTVGCNFATGVSEIRGESEEVKVYPNPSTGMFTFQSSVLSGKSSVEVYNVLGEQVLTETLHSTQGDNLINLSGQPNGVYFYRVISETGNLVGEGKIVIQK